MAVSRRLISNQTEDREGRNNQDRDIKGTEASIGGPAWTTGPRARADCVHLQVAWHDVTAEHKNK